MASRISTSRQRRSITPRLFTPPPDSYKASLREIKTLYLRRRYKQCASLSTDLLRKFEGQLHALHESYLRYYAAASYETLGHIAHNFSSNKIPLLYMAKDEYHGCKISLEGALEELEEELENLTPSIDAIEDIFTQNSTRVGCPSVFDDDMFGPRGSPWAAIKSNVQHKVPNKEAAFCLGNGRSRFSSPFYSSEGDDSDDQLQMSDRAKLMPLPLSIRKSYAGQPSFTGSPVSRAIKQPVRPSSGPLAAVPLFSLSPLEPAIFSSGPITADKSKPRIVAKKNEEHYTRMATQITSLITQVTANIGSVRCLIEKTAELQRIHNASKPQRLASFWSFTPAFEAPSPSNNVTKYNSVSGSSTGSSRKSSSTTATTTSTECTAVDDAKQERIERLRAQGWRSVGIRDPERKWKGAEYYESLCSQALAELYRA